MMYSDENPDDAAVNRFYYERASTQLRGPAGLEDTVKTQGERLKEAVSQMAVSIGSNPYSTPDPTRPIGGFEATIYDTLDDDHKKKLQEQAHNVNTYASKPPPGLFTANDPNDPQNIANQVAEGLKKAAEDVAKGVGKGLESIFGGALKGISSTILLPALVVGGVLILRR